MKINTQTPSFALNKTKINQKSQTQVNSNGPAVNVQIRRMDNLKVAKNNPSDPTVATKVLDGLHSGMIDFTGPQRDAIAKILSSRAEKIETKD